MNVLFKRGLSDNLVNVIPPKEAELASSILYLTTDTDMLHVNKVRKLVELVDGTTRDVLDANGDPILESYITPLLAPNPFPLTVKKDGKVRYEYDGSTGEILDLDELGKASFQYGTVLPDIENSKEGDVFFQLVDVENEWDIQNIELTGAVVGSGIYDEENKSVTISTIATLAPLTFKVDGASQGIYDGSMNKEININLSASYVRKAGDTMTGPLKISKIPEMDDELRVPTLVLGRTDENDYLELDCNKIQGKTANNKVQDLYLNEKGGKVHIGVEDLGKENQFIYLVDGVPVESTFSAGSDKQLIYIQNGEFKSSISNIGKNNQFVFVQEGKITASEFTAGSNIRGIYINKGEIIESTATIGSSNNPVYFNSGDIVASTSSVGSEIIPIYMQNGSFVSSVATVGNAINPIYMQNGIITASTETVGNSINPVYMEDGTFKASRANIGASNKLTYLENGIITETADTIGESIQPIYMLNGELVATTTTVGSNLQFAYMDNGKITASTASKGNNLQPIYLSNGLFINSDATVGSESEFMYMQDGTFKRSIVSIGSSTKPIYLNNGKFTQCSDTLNINITGNAATSTVADSCEEAYYAQSATVAATAQRLSTPKNINIIGSVSGSASFDGSSDITINVVSTDTDSEGHIQIYDTALDYNYYITGVQGSGSQLLYRAFNTVGTENQVGVYFNGVSGVLYGAAWNDYAEYRETKEDIEAGRVIIENGDGTLSLSTERLQPGAEIVSDTFGFAIGETSKCKTPVAASGRVLAYPNEDRNSYKPGDAVCAGPNGTVSKMTRREIKKYPERIIGVVSEIPTYEVWGQNDVKVNNRIWIRIK